MSIASGTIIVIPGRSEGSSPEPRTDAVSKTRLTQPTRFMTERIGSGFRARRCAAPRNDGGGSALNI